MLGVEASQYSEGCVHGKLRLGSAETNVSGELILCATPIGNLEDISQRALRTIGQADVLACEDTRRARKLLAHFGLKPHELVVYNDANERRQAKVLLDHMKQGRSVVLVSDAGMPGLSDPGYRLVRACVEAGVDVSVVPGPSAGLSALAASGLPPARFVFEGFLPRKPGDRRRRLQQLAGEPRTLVVYESPHRIAECLADLSDVLGDRPSVLARELTKLHEEFRRGRLSELLEGVRQDPPRGEIVLVIEGARTTEEQVEPSDLARRARDLMEHGVDRREALAQVAKGAGVRRRQVFDALLELRDE